MKLVQTIIVYVKFLNLVTFLVTSQNNCPYSFTVYDGFLVELIFLFLDEQVDDCKAIIANLSTSFVFKIVLLAFEQILPISCLIVMDHVDIMLIYKVVHCIDHLLSCKGAAIL